MGRIPTSIKEESVMARTWAVLLILASFLLVAPIIESGTSGSQVFQAIVAADAGGGG
jgi:hypothetical protein